MASGAQGDRPVERRWLFIGLVGAVWLGLATRRLGDGIAWEDSYHHWLVAAHFARTGLAVDVLGGGANGWLPLYHWLAGGVLAVVGWHNLAALEGLAVGLTFATAVLIAVGRGVGAAALFLWGPIAVLGGSLAVAEPLAVLLAVVALLCWEKSGKLWSLVGALAWSLVALTDRSSWPAVIAALAWGLYTRRTGAWLPAPALALGLWLTRADGNRTAVWAAVDQAAQGDALARLGDLAGYSLQPLLLPLLLGGLGLVWAWRRPEARLLAVILACHLGALFTLVALGKLTGSHRYYLLDVALLALLAGMIPAPARRLVLPAAAVLVAVSLRYLALWPRWVALNRPSEAAGRFLSSRPPVGRLVTDSPVIAYFSGWPPEQIAGGGAPLAGAAYIAALVDRRYSGVYPLLVRCPGLVAGRAPAHWLPVWQLHDWSESYGAKPVGIWQPERHGLTKSSNKACM